MANTEIKLSEIIASDAQVSVNEDNSIDLGLNIVNGSKFTDNIVYESQLIYNEFQNAQNSFSSMVEHVAVLQHSKMYLDIVKKGIVYKEKYEKSDCYKSVNEYLIDLLNCSKSTASELKKVAETFYNSVGKLKNSDFSVFKYSELVKLANCDEEVRELVAESIKGLETHTKKDVLTAIDNATAELIGQYTGVKPQIQSSSDNTPEKSDNSDSDSEWTENTDNVDDSEAKDSKNVIYSYNSTELLPILTHLTSLIDNSKMSAKLREQFHADINKIKEIAHFE